MCEMLDDRIDGTLAAHLGDKKPSGLRMKNSAQEHDDDAVCVSIRSNWDARVAEGIERMELLAH
jgi:hypothetical protein